MFHSVSLPRFRTRGNFVILWFFPLQQSAQSNFGASQRENFVILRLRQRDVLVGKIRLPKVTSYLDPAFGYFSVFVETSESTEMAALSRIVKFEISSFRDYDIACWSLETAWLARR